MNQQQFEMIVKIIEGGAPALANELCGALANLVNAYNTLVKEKAAADEATKKHEESEEK